MATVLISVCPDCGARVGDLYYHSTHDCRGARPLVIGIDPGPKESALVVFDGVAVRDHLIAGNLYFVGALRQRFAEQQRRIAMVCFEQVESFGMAVGGDIFETVFWTGRLFQIAVEVFGIARCDRMPRKVAKLHLCHSIRAKDPNVRQALMDRFGSTRAAALGTKAAPGPLYGVRSHEWSALAIALTRHDQLMKQTQEQSA